jgi:hypothetical protein
MQLQKCNINKMTTSLAAQYGLRHPDNPVVFFDIPIGGFPAGRIKMELFAYVVPRTAEKFRQFCKVESRKEILPGTEAALRFDLLESAFIGWRERDAVVEQ